MVSREHKRASVLHDKLQLLRSITHSHALGKKSIIVEASKYIEELKHKVESANQDIVNIAQTSTNQLNTILPAVKVEPLKKGFDISVFSEKNCPGLLVYILEAFEELGLNVLEARVSCADSFLLRAVGGENEEEGEGVDVEAVKQAMLLAIKNWSEVYNGQD